MGAARRPVHVGNNLVPQRNEQHTSSIRNLFSVFAVPFPRTFKLVFILQAGLGSHCRGLLSAVGRARSFHSRASRRPFSCFPTQPFRHVSTDPAVTCRSLMSL